MSWPAHGKAGKVDHLVQTEMPRKLKAGNNSVDIAGVKSGGDRLVLRVLPEVAGRARCEAEEGWGASPRVCG